MEITKELFKGQEDGTYLPKCTIGHSYMTSNGNDYKNYHRKSPLGERGFSLSLRGLIPYATGCAEGGKDGRRY